MARGSGVGAHDRGDQNRTGVAARSAAARFAGSSRERRRFHAAIRATDRSVDPHASDSNPSVRRATRTAADVAAGASSYPGDKSASGSSTRVSNGSAAFIVDSSGACARTCPTGCAQLHANVRRCAGVDRHTAACAADTDADITGRSSQGGSTDSVAASRISTAGRNAKACASSRGARARNSTTVAARQLHPVVRSSRLSSSSPAATNLFRAPSNAAHAGAVSGRSTSSGTAWWRWRFHADVWCCLSATTVVSRRSATFGNATAASRAFDAAAIGAAVCAAACSISICRTAARSRCTRGRGTAEDSRHVAVSRNAAEWFGRSPAECDWCDASRTATTRRRAATVRATTVGSGSANVRGACECASVRGTPTAPQRSAARHHATDGSTVRATIAIRQQSGPGRCADDAARAGGGRSARATSLRERGR